MAGIGVDAAGFAALGHSVVAVEPVDAMRAVAINDRDHENIDWLNDKLPDLEKVRAQDCRFAFILLSASFMHLPPEAQAPAFQSLNDLAAERGVIAMSLRHGPVPEGRTMFEISPDAARDMAVKVGWEVVLHEERGDPTNRPGVSWSNLVFRKGN